MIKTEYYTTRNDGVILVKSYSTRKKYILQNETGLEYDVAIDVGVYEYGEYRPLKYTYIETEKDIEL
jgi:hypothetical protein